MGVPHKYLYKGYCRNVIGRPISSMWTLLSTRRWWHISTNSFTTSAATSGPRKPLPKLADLKGREVCVCVKWFKFKGRSVVQCIDGCSITTLGMAAYTYVCIHTWTNQRDHEFWAIWHVKDNTGVYWRSYMYWQWNRVSVITATVSCPIIEN